MTPPFLRGRRKSGAVGFVLRSLAGEARGGTRLQIRLSVLQTFANGLAEVGRNRKTGDTARAFITGGDLERRREKFGDLRRQRDCARRAIPKIRLTRDKNRYHGYPKDCAKDHETNYRQNARSSLGVTLCRGLKGFRKL